MSRTLTPNNSLLAGKTILVIGGGGRLGSAFCEGIVGAGGRVVVADFDLAAATRVANDIGDDTADAAQIDITQIASVTSVIRAAVDRHGHIDGLVNSAYPRNANYGRKFEDVAYADFADNLSSHVGGIFLASQQYWAYLNEVAKPGCIVNIASIYGVIAPRFDIYNNTQMTMPVEYAAIKAAVIHLTKYMAKYFFGTATRVNCVSPGGILADQPEPFLSNYRRYCAEEGMLDRHDISGAVIFLLSDQARFVTGQNLVVDDGFSL